jgi:thiosulfate/3-mercaptopyruvate sulfurtransferase
MNSRIKLLAATAFISISASIFGQLETNILPSDFEMHLRSNPGIKVIALCKPEEFVKGHIGSAVQIGRKDYEDKSIEFSGMMAPRDSISALLSSCGISSEDTIFLYDHKGGCDAARFWWILNVYGHKNTHFLNGSDKDLSKVVGIASAIEQSEYLFPNAIDPTLYADLEYVLKAIKRGAKLLDVRTIEEFEGSIIKDGAFTAGRIQHALFYPWINAIKTNGNQRLKGKDILKEQFEGLGLEKDEEIIIYCHSGARSAHTTFVLTEILKYTNVKNYEGSWIEYSFNKELPTETGEQIAEYRMMDKDEPYSVQQIFLMLLAAMAIFGLYRYQLRKRG